MILASEDEDYQKKQHQCHPRKIAEMFIELAINGTFHLGFRQLLHVFLQSSLSGRAIVNIDVSTFSGLCNLAAHILIEFGDNDIAGIVGDIVIGARHRDRATLRRTNAKDRHFHAFLHSITSSLYGPTLVVLTVSDDKDGTPHTFLLCETVRRQIDGASDICTLNSNHTGVDIVEEHLGGHVIAGNRQLSESIAGKDNKTNLIVNHIVHHVGNE